EVLDDVVGAQLGALDALAAAVLRAVVVTAGALDVAATGDGDHHLLLGDEVFDRHVAVEAEEDLGAAIVAVLLRDLGELFRDDAALQRLIGEDQLVAGDLGLEFGEAVLDLLAFERGETTQLQGENRIRLQFVDIEQLDESGPRLLDVGGAADERDDLVERV